MNSSESERILAGIAELVVGLKAVETRLVTVEARLQTVEADCGATRQLVEKQPDVRLIGHQIVALIDRVGALEEKNVRALAAINDFARDNVTPGEVEALHSGLAEARQTDFKFDVRLRRVEDELHLTP